MRSVRELLGPEGPLARMAGYELRPGQLEMASAVEHALDTDSILLCEAGTGTGKTLAYLVPALRSGLRVVVSTATKALQAQIVESDLPLIRRELGLEARVQLLKGLGNYLCLRRMAELEASPELGAGGAAGELRRALRVVRPWSERTETGDIAELDELAEDHPVWAAITSSSDTRIGPRCRFFDVCHVTNVKRAAEQAELLVVNHHLFFADLALRGDHPGGALPPYDAVILDEAHKIEDIATTFFGARVSSPGIERLLGDAARTLDRAEARAPLLLERARSHAERMFALLNLHARGHDARQRIDEGWFSGPLREAYHALDDALDALEQHAATWIGGEATAHLAARVAAMRKRLATVVDPPAAAIGWLERRARGIELSSSPIDVGPALRERLFEHGGAVVLTSASLTTAGSFDFMRSRLGLGEPVTPPVEELMVPSSLCYRTQALLYTPTDLPEVDHADFAPRAAERIAALARAAPGGAFVLCTSVRAMQALARLLADFGMAPMVQGQAPKPALLDRFRRDGRALLVATMSFWEGVDVPGDALSLVVIDRLPFAVPTDPIVAARCRALEEAGAPPFSRYTVPQAALLLKQGFGRLLRNRRDRGVVAILDRRICKRGYGRALLSSLPEAARSETLADVERFWGATA